ncbi:hypothetical protein TWF694_002981 [Orbilia ellipsospora]|uniref:Uncharacterized protein n=1 Tax=Orbilia ellipsospora TaxID=2528407 RepID=A0AAV9X2K7_9PEZI
MDASEDLGTHSTEISAQVHRLYVSSGQFRRKNQSGVPEPSMTSMELEIGFSVALRPVNDGNSVKTGSIVHYNRDFNILIVDYHEYLLEYCKNR